MVKRFLPVFLFLSFSYIGVSDSYSQWVSDSTKNTPVCVASGSQQNPLVISDGNDGAIIVWQDYRNNNWDIFAQHLDAGGVPKWGDNGKNLCTAATITNTNQTAPVVTTDGNGGAYVVWKDARQGGTDLDLYAQHISSDGTLVYGTGGAGVCVNKPDATQPTNIAICSDGFGNAFVAWEDYRSSISPSGNRPDIYMNKLTGNGVAWGAGGSAKIVASSKQVEPALTSDGNGGCVLAWVTDGTVPSSLRAAQISSSGTVGWNGGVLVYKDQLSTNPVDNVKIERDGSQYMLSFQVKDGSNSANGWDMFAQRLKSDGTLVWNTTSSAPQISRSWFGDQINATVFSDDSVESNNLTGLMVVYENDGTKKSVVMTRLIADGDSFVPSYPNHIYTVSNVSTGDQSAPAAVKIGTGELMVAWVDNRFVNYTSIYGQRVNRWPHRFLGPSASNSTWGEAISNHKSSDADQVALAPRTNGAIAVWRDNRNGNTDIYAQLIFKDGSLPVELSSFNATAIANGQVLINWQTANEKDNAGFEVERRKISGNASNTYEVIGSYRTDGSLAGSSFSNTTRYYTHIDQPTEAGSYEYRIVDYTLDGERTTHEPKLVELSSTLDATTWSVSQNFPNPFSNTTKITFQTPQQSIVDIEVFDALGRSLVKPMTATALDRGFHSVTVNANELPANQIVYYSVTARDVTSGAILWKTPAAMMMQVSK
ncbi:MAG TPA: hypothetical protein VFO76_02110 [Candidatus Kapabacteria bacterium]|nr:hypothetical protein [Candidatus Kapabacteria bacterium]